MKKNTLLIGLGLISLSIILHVIHIIIFKDPHHLFIYLMGDIAFIPLEVFFVTLVLDRVIDHREEGQRLKKTNMLIGLFYQELGNTILDHFVSADNTFDYLNTKVDFKWDKEQYKVLSAAIKKHNHSVDLNMLNLEQLNESLRKKQDLVVTLLTNPSVQEHEVFTDSLMNLFHLQEELMQRSLQDLSTYDRDHLKVDIKRAYRNLSIGWVEHLSHLQEEYPYLFLSAISHNPFDCRNRSEIEKEVILSR